MSDNTVGMDAGGEQPQKADAAAGLPGSLLAARREELQWSVEDVAQALHLAPRQIHAIESDNYSALPGMAVTRGFIRSYAKLLKLDPAPLLQMIASETIGKVDDVPLRRALPAKPFYANRSLNLTTSSGTWARRLIWVLLILLTALLVAWKAEWLPQSWIAELESVFQVAGDPPQKEVKLQENNNAGVNPSAESQNNASTANDSGSALAETQATNANPAEKNPAGFFAGHQPEGATVPPGSTRQADVSGRAAGIAENKNMLVLKLREDSWIEIRSAQNKILLARLAKAGESEAISVSKPIKLTIGNAAGVDAELRGVPVELTASAKNNVARLTVN
jgi:cytoskeleton protein RodZ